MAIDTRFRIFLQPPYVRGFEEPVTVVVETDVKIEDGPTDNLLYVLDAENKPGYRAEAPNYQPYRGRPWNGRVSRRRARPRNGHFDHLAPDDPTFPAASVYATARLVLNFWNRIFRESGLAEVDTWHHSVQDLLDEGEEVSLAPRLQLVPRSVSAGSRSGYGYVEVGYDNPGHQYIAAGEVRFTYQKGKMWQNFDVIAHEMGHVILFKRIGFPQSAGEVTDWFQIQDAEFLAFHESMADLCAILSLLDIKQARERILATKGGINVLAGVGELQNLAEPGFLPIRSALNKEKYPGPGQLQNNLESHKHSLPLTGAVFDSLLRVYERLEDSSANPDQAEEALDEAHDIIARALAKLWSDPANMWESPEDRTGFSLLKASAALVALIETELSGRINTQASSSGEIARQFAAHDLWQPQAKSA